MRIWGGNHGVWRRCHRSVLPPASALLILCHSLWARAERKQVHGSCTGSWHLLAQSLRAGCSLLASGGPAVIFKSAWRGPLLQTPAGALWQVQSGWGAGSHHLPFCSCLPSPAPQLIRLIWLHRIPLLSAFLPFFGKFS